MPVQARDRSVSQRGRRRLPPIATILVGTAVGQGVVIAISPLLTRLYTPADFGVLAIVTALASIVGAGATLGTDRALVVADSSAVPALVRAGVTSALAVAATAAIVTWSLRDRLADRFVAPALAELWWLVPVSVLAVAVQRIGSAVLARQRAHRSIAIRNVAQGLGQTAWNLSMAFAGPIGLVGGVAAGRFAAVLGTSRLRAPVVGSPARVSIGSALRLQRRFVLLSPWSAMLNVIGQQAPGLVIAAVHGSTLAGFVALTMRVLGSPVGMAADAVAQYAAGAFGVRIRSSDPVRSLLVRLVGRLLMIGVSAALVVVLLGPVTFGALFGPEWAVSGTYAQILVPAFAIQVAVSPVTQLLSMLGQQSVQLIWDAGRLVATTAAVLVPSLLGAPMAVVLGVLAGAMTLSYVVMLVLVVRATRVAAPPRDVRTR